MAKKGIMDIGYSGPAEGVKTDQTVTTPTPMRTVEIWTDGACSGNPGPGGWAALLRSDKGKEEELFGSEWYTTNICMEMTAAIEALEWLKNPRRVKLHTDSDLVVRGMTEWLFGWKDNDWRGSGKKPVANRGLWERLEAAAARHNVEWIKVRGHSGHLENERVDRLAKAAITNARNSA